MTLSLHTTVKLETCAGLDVGVHRKVGFEDCEMILERGETDYILCLFSASVLLYIILLHLN